MVSLKRSWAATSVGNIFLRKLAAIVLWCVVLGVRASDVGDDESVRMTVVVHLPIGGDAYSCFLSSPDNDAGLTYARYQRTRTNDYYYNYYNREPVGTSPIDEDDWPGSARINLDPGYNNYFGIFYCRARKAGSIPTTITATVLRSNAVLAPARGLYTQTVNAGDVGVEIEMKKLSTSTARLSWRFNDSAVLQTSTSPVYTVAGPVSSRDAGVYECHYEGSRNLAQHAMIRLIVRDCPAGRWGRPACYGICDRCYNGGVCNDRNGRCQCPAGFTGPNCLTTCGPNRAGFNCGILCSSRLQSCMGQLFCLPDPMGCTCGSGFQWLRCNTECDPGQFGANCLQECHCRQATSCDKVTGECIGTYNGCATGWSGTSCQIPDVCDNEYYGDECTLKCQCMDGQRCNKDTGQCSNGQCREGFATYSGRLYCEECRGGTWGLNCAGTCNCRKSSCNRVTGTCDGGCRSNWALPDCTTGVLNFSNAPVNSGQASVFTCIVTGSTVDSDSVRVYRLATGGTYPLDTATVEGDNIVLTYSIPDVLLGEEFSCNILWTSASFTISASMYELPALTYPPRAGKITGRDVAVTWDAWDPDGGDPGDPPIVGYAVYYRRAAVGGAPTAEWLRASVVGPAVLASTVGGLEPETDYDIAVSVSRAGEGGEGSPGPVLSVTTLCTEPTRSPGNLQAFSQRERPGEITLTWQELEAEYQGCSTGVTHYVIRFSPSGPPYDYRNATATNATLAGLQPYTDYGVSVGAGNAAAAGVGPWSDEVRARSPEERAPPPSLSVTASDLASVTLLVQAASPHNRNGNVNHYVLRYRKVTGEGGLQGEPVVREVPETGFEWRYTIDNLDAMTDYTIELKIVNGVGESDWSDAVRARTVETGGTGSQSVSGGGIAAAIIVILLLIAAVIVLVVVVRRKRFLKPRSSKDSNADGLETKLRTHSYDNAIYENTVQGNNANPSKASTLASDAVIYENTDVCIGLPKKDGTGTRSPIPQKPTRRPPPPLSAGRRTSGPRYQTTPDGPPRQEEEEEEALKKADALDEDSISSPTPSTDEQCQYGNLNLAPALSRPIPVDKLEDYIEKKKASTTDNLKYEFTILPSDKRKPWEVASRPDLKTRNRFKNIIPYDHSRVPLEPIEGVPLSHYYNASYIQDHAQQKSFIAAMGPNSASVRDFWRMIWQKQITVIVMLTQLVENNKDKCKRYWPTRVDEEERHGRIKVRLVDREPFSDYTISTLQVSQIGLDEPQRTVRHFNFTSWPDMGVPLYPTSVLSLVQVVKDAQRDETGGRVARTGTPPLLVHCSAGVGRTGTFIAIYTLLDKMTDTKDVSVFSYVNQMREDRVNMVQTYDQYLFIYSALLERHLCGDTRIPVKVFVDQLVRLKKLNPKSRKRYIEEEFNILNRVTRLPGKSAYGMALDPDNAAKNRFPDILPLECNRPSLISTSGNEESTYINATFVDSFRQKDVFITTQMPLPGTVNDLWRLVYDWNCSTIVMMNDSYSPNEELGQYLPDSDADFGQLTVEVLEQTKGRIYTATTLRVSKQNSEDECLTVRHLQLQGWATNENKPNSPLSILELFDAMQKWQRESEESTRTIVHCINGIGRSGVFCAVSTVFEKIGTEEVIDVFQAVKRLRMNSPRMIESLDQYILCYEVIGQHLERFKYYDNLD